MRLLFVPLFLSLCLPALADDAARSLGPLKRVSPADEKPDFLAKVLGQNSSGVPYGVMDRVARIAAPDHWLVETGHEWNQKFLCLMKLDRKTGKSVVVQKIEAAGHWCYVPKGNLLFAGRFKIEEAEKGSFMEPKLVYECFDLSNNQPLWTLPEEASVLSTTLSHDGSQLIVLHGGPMDRKTAKGPAWLSWYDMKSGAMTRKVELPGLNRVQVNLYDHRAIADTPEITYVSRHSEDLYQCLEIARKSETAEPMSGGDDGFDGSGASWFIEISDDLQWLAFHYEQEVRLFKRTGAELAQVETFEAGNEPTIGDDLRNVVFNPKSTHLAVGSMRETSLFNLQTKKMDRTFKTGTELSDFSADGSLLVLWDDGGSWPIEVDRAAAAEKAPVLEIQHDCPVSELSFSKDGKYLVSGDGVHFIVWDLMSGKALAMLASPKEKDPDFRAMTSPVIVPGHGKIYGVDGWDVLEWDLLEIERNRKLEAWVGKVAFGRAGNAERQGFNMDVAVDASGERFVETNARSLWYFNRSKPTERIQLNIGENGVFFPRRFHIPEAADVVMVSTLGRSMLVGLNGTDPHIALKKNAGILTSSGMAYAFADDYKTKTRRSMAMRYPVGDDDDIVNDQIEVMNAPAMYQWHLIDATENNRLLVYKNGYRQRDEISVMDWDKKELVRTFQSPTLIKRLKTSPDGRYLAAAGSDKKIYLWDLSDL